MTERNAVERTIQILDVLSDAGRGLSVSEIAIQTSIPKSSVYRFIQSFQKLNLVYRSSSGLILLGPSILRIASAARKHFDQGVSEIALPLMKGLTQRTGETSFLTAVVGLHATCIEIVRSPRAIHLSFDRGQLFPLYAGASSIVFLPYMGKEIRNQVLQESEGKSYGHGGPINAEELRKCLTFNREQGYAITTGEVDADATGIAAPIFNRRNDIVAALSLAGPTLRFTDRLDQLLSEVVQTAKAIEEKLPY